VGGALQCKPPAATSQRFSNQKRSQRRALTGRPLAQFQVLFLLLLSASLQALSGPERGAAMGWLWSALK
jgi:hypothetical protein